MLRMWTRGGEQIGLRTDPTGVPMRRKVPSKGTHSAKRVYTRRHVEAKTEISAEISVGPTE
jgi:hypothetical protein